MFENDFNFIVEENLELEEEKNMITIEEFGNKIDILVGRLKLRNVEITVEKNRMWFHVYIITDDFLWKNTKRA